MKRHGMAAAILSLAVLLAACSPASEPVSGEPSAVSWDSLTVESGLDLFRWVRKQGLDITPAAMR